MTNKNKLGKTILMMAAIAVLPLVILGTAHAAETTQGTTKTADNLQTAFNEESNAQSMYLAFADKAKAEGYMDVYRLFSATAKAEEIGAAYHAKILHSYNVTPKADVKTPVVKTTAENLKSVIERETNERNTLYPALIQQADVDKDAKAARAFKGAMAVRAEHLKSFTEALTNLPTWKNSGKKFMVCAECGYMTTDFSLVKCPVCSYPRSQFIEFK